MSDRDRLIKLLEQGRGTDTMPCQEDDDYDCTGMTCEICENRRCADLILADGWIKPPCKVGDKIYFVVEYDGKYFLDEGEVGSIYKDNGGVWVSARYDSGLHYHHKESDFGKTVFLTKEEAEKALKERKGG